MMSLVFKNIQECTFLFFFFFLADFIIDLPYNKQWGLEVS